MYRFFKTLCQNRLALSAFLLVLLFTFFALLSFIDMFFFNEKIISSLLYSPSRMSVLEKLQPPSWKHILGTDQLGRDLLARIIYGSMVSLVVCILAVGLSGITGTVIGLIAGYSGGLIDDIVMRIVDIMLAFPGIILAIAVAGFLGPGFFSIVLALAVKSWVIYARLIRSRVLEIKNQEYVRAAYAMGAGNARIIFRHILPNCISTLIVQAAMDMGTIMIAEAGLSFIGLGPQPSLPSWGNMLSTGRNYITNGWWLSVFPGLAIFLTVLCFNLIGDILQEVFDPKLKNKKGE
ncbi:MAG: ABC transporter permease [Halanaerobiaceae bacterium]|nr:ABC transporter permease [Halanaerobiaceae bacterium]